MNRILIAMAVAACMTMPATAMSADQPADKKALSEPKAQKKAYGSKPSARAGQTDKKPKSAAAKKAGGGKKAARAKEETVKPKPAAVTSTGSSSSDPPLRFNPKKEP